jgi:hypothetical protein
MESGGYDTIILRLEIFEEFFEMEREKMMVENVLKRNQLRRSVETERGKSGS